MDTDNEGTIYATAVNQFASIFGAFGLAMVIGATQVWTYPLPRMAFLQTGYHAFVAALAVLILPQVAFLTAVAVMGRSPPPKSQKISEWIGMFAVTLIVLAACLKFYTAAGPLIDCAFANPEKCTQEV